MSKQLEKELFERLCPFCHVMHNRPWHEVHPDESIKYERKQCGEEAEEDDYITCPSCGEKIPL